MTHRFPGNGSSEAHVFERRHCMPTEANEKLFSYRTMFNMDFERHFWLSAEKWRKLKQNMVQLFACIRYLRDHLILRTQQK